MSGRLTRLRAGDGHDLAAYRSEPAGARRGGVVILHEIFGANAHIREVCDGYAGRDYTTLAPALFDRIRPGVELGYDASGVETGRALREDVGWDAALADVRAAVDALRRDGAVAVVGYCWGGTLAFLAAARIDGVACAVSYYGGQTVPFAAEAPTVPVLMHFGEFDPRIPPEDRETIRRHNPQIEMHLFPADHGFNCDHRKEWHQPSAEMALTLTHEFLERHM